MVLRTTRKANEKQTCHREENTLRHILCRIMRENYSRQKCSASPIYERRKKYLKYVDILRVFLVGLTRTD